MFVVSMRFAAGLAIGAAAAMWLSSRRTAASRPMADTPAGDESTTITDPRQPGRPVPQRFSDYRTMPDGQIEEGNLIDSAVEDTFPASDPPAFMQPVIIGLPPQDEADASRDARHESAMGESGGDPRARVPAPTL